MFSTCLKFRYRLHIKFNIAAFGKIEVNELFANKRNLVFVIINLYFQVCHKTTGAISKLVLWDKQQSLECVELFNMWGLWQYPNCLLQINSSPSEHVGTTVIGSILIVYFELTVHHLTMSYISSK